LPGNVFKKRKRKIEGPTFAFWGQVPLGLSPKRGRKKRKKTAKNKRFEEKRLGNLVIRGK